MNCKKILHEAGYQVLSKTPIDKASVSEIIQTADISRQTFYRYYPDKFALANDIFDALFVNAYYRPEDVLSGGGWLKMLECQFIEFTHHLEFVRNVYSSFDINGTAMHDAEQCMIFDREFIRLQGGNPEDPYIAFAIEVKDKGGIDYLRRWLQADMPFSAKEMANRFYMVIPKAIVPYYL